MKITKLVALLSLVIMCSSCGNDDDKTIQRQDNVNEILTSYDIWLIEPSQESSNLFFVQDALTFSFKNNHVYSKENILDFDINEPGEDLGSYSAHRDLDTGIATLEMQDSEFTVYGSTASNVLRIVDTNTNDAYYITGYQQDNFPLEDLYYRRMPHFLKEYDVWKKTETQNPGDSTSIFLAVNYLKFPATFKFLSSTDAQGLPNDDISYPEGGSYAVLYHETDTENSIPEYYEMVLRYLDEETDTIIRTDTLKVLDINETSLKLSQVKKNISYTFEGSN